MNYTEEQIKDIEERTKQADEQIKSLNLRPVAYVTKVNIGDDVFVDKVGVFLEDTKYAPKNETVSTDK